MSLSSLLGVPPGPVDLSSYDTNGHPGFDGDKDAGKKALAGMAAPLSDLQERLFADGKAAGTRSILLVLQGMDTSGKGGILRHAVGLFDPQGVHIKAFKAPTDEETQHDFLWRIAREVPDAGMIGIFDRSHYEDVLIAKVRGFADDDEIERRYGAINDFEARLVDSGTTVIKCMLHVSSDTQEERLLERLDNPAKHWKYNPGDVDERALWPKYQRAYETALERCNTEAAPWHVVPADRKWYRNWAIASLLHEGLEAFELGWPTADFDVETERARLLALEL
ncbi:MAG: PPK2 family polyphosphate kinase [Nocardioides sp.]